MSESLWPREHGAYAQLIFPILSGLLPGHPGPAAFAIAAAAIFLFLGWTLVAVQVVALGLLVLRPGITR